MSTSTIPVADVVVGERARREYGDLTSLMDSIREHGLLQPIGLSPGNHLLFGGRRLEAVKRLGLLDVPVTRPETRTDVLSLLKAERDENTCRKDMTPEELVDLGLRIEEMERPKARDRQAEGQRAGGFARHASASGSTEPKAENGRTNEVVSEALGLSTPTYKRMKHVVTTARNEDEAPEVREAAKSVLTSMNAGEIGAAAAYRRVRESRNGRDAQREEGTVATTPQPAPASRPGPKQKHSDRLERITNTLSGVQIAADEITELDDSLTKEEAARAMSDLSRQIRSLNRIKNLLKEYTND